MIANYHTHTYRCRHAGEYADREYIEAAIKAGYKELGFSDHAPIIEKWDRPCMLPESLPDYVEKILALKEEYADSISIYLGLEAEYVPDIFDKFMDVVESYPFDYMILGQHDIFGEPEYVRTFWKTDSLKYFDTYCQQCTDAMMSGVYSYWAHPDIMHYVGDSHIFEQKMRQMCRVAKQTDTPLEFNLLGFGSKCHYPDPDFWRIAAEEGNKVIFGCDAHAPSHIFGIDDKLKRAEEMVASLGLDIIDLLPLKKPVRKDQNRMEI